MRKDRYSVVGVMSGTSLDGIDLARVELWKDAHGWHYKIIEATTLTYPEDMVKKLRGAIDLDTDSLRELDISYTHYLGRTIAGFLSRFPKDTVDAVCSHGHTVVHRPDEGITLQIGNRLELSEHLEVTVVCDFRPQDVELGGQGAPLVPMGDRLLFGDYDHCLNLGGFANVSFEQDGMRVAYDLCPLNVVLNSLASSMGEAFDKGGQLAASGTVDHGLLQELNALDFYKLEGPKSLGVEWVEAEFWPLLSRTKLDPKDKLATVTAHMGGVIGKSLHQAHSVLITGGGAYNSHLLECIRAYTSAQLVVPEPELVEFKEALVFALLGVLRLRQEVNVLASVTGSRHDHSSGRIYLR